MSIFKFEGRVALITGAGSGIGQALAVSLAERGADLALLDINAEGLEQTRKLVDPLGGSVSTYLCDISSADEIAAIPDRIKKDHGRLDVLVNNAGVALGGSFKQISDADFEWLLGINLLGPVRLTRAMLPMLEAAEESRIVNISSIYGIIPVPGQTAYCASKFGLRGFSNALRYELRETRVGVTTVHPGGVNTQIAEVARQGSGVSDTEMREGRKAAAKVLTLPPGKAAEVIVKAVENRKARVFVGTDARIVAVLERLFPVRVYDIVERLMARP